MLPKTKRGKSLPESARRAREGIKKAKVNDGAGTSLSAQENPVTSLPVHPAIQISDCSPDATYDAKQEIADSPKLRLEHFVEDWILSLFRDNTVSLALFLCHQLEQLLGFTATNAAEYTLVMLGSLNVLLDSGEVISWKQEKFVSLTSEQEYSDRQRI